MTPQRIVTTEAWTASTAGVNTLELAEAGAHPLRINMLFLESPPRRALQSGMSDGMAMGFDRMDDILAELAAA